VREGPPATWPDRRIRQRGSDDAVHGGLCPQAAADTAAEARRAAEAATALDRAGDGARLNDGHLARRRGVDRQRAWPGRTEGGWLRLWLRGGGSGAG
jgi:hypothetical protein